MCLRCRANNIHVLKRPGVSCKNEKSPGFCPAKKIFWLASMHYRGGSGIMEGNSIFSPNPMRGAGVVKTYNFNAYACKT